MKGRTGREVTVTPDPEIRTLLSVLDGQHRHVLGILDGLDPDDLQRPGY